MHLTTPRAIVLAAVLITAAIGAAAAFPRYEIQMVPNSAAVARIDHWTGTIAITSPNETRGPASWLTFEHTAHATAAPVSAPARRFPRQSLAVDAALGAGWAVAITAVLFGIQRSRRKGQTTRSV